MALLAIEGFDHYGVNADMVRRVGMLQWVSAGGLTAGRGGVGQAIRLAWAEGPQSGVLGGNFGTVLYGFWMMGDLGTQLTFTIGESVGVWGVGGVGTHIVQLARLVGAAPIIAIDINPAVRDRALDLGADFAFDSRDPELKDRIEEVTAGRKLDVAFDAVGKKVTFEQALDCLTVGGRLVSVGMSAESPTVGPTSMFGLTKRRVLGHLGYQNSDIETLAKLVSLGRLDLSRSISRIIPLEDIADGIDMLERADGNPIRILVQP